ncbi:Transglutaminase-like superfamily protein [Butyrivibrio fibrisolvens DSM 3071]|uniref:Transglutaminase-like superfamily protein n=1 Tax=Butyrivibrio fibrisolvens DSM 3071 TaxID=1121131 RepID=A0A1M5YMB7_BUTFI|nr:lasso peptide biosynthesis B2 protein [Butyrivibrio fibrisolvens]SHI13235.1 Transglutaminase-like superfamily protein [Butyrivibrio fibrisolvens DSM 3071]
MINLRSFIFDNKEKSVTIKAYIYSFYYRYIVKHTPAKKLEDRLGVRGEETPYEESRDKIDLAKLYAFHINRITERLPWEEKCLVRALSLRKFLIKKNIPCTIYLGVKTEKGKLEAHAWLRCGNLWATGGNGDEYTTVAKFATY